ELFHPREISLFRSMKEESHRESRIRAICYVLVAQKQMMLEKVGREIQFRAWREYGYGPNGRSTNKRGSGSPVRPTPERPLFSSREYEYYQNKMTSLEATQAGKGAKSLTKQENDNRVSLLPLKVCQSCGAKVSLRKWNRHVSGRCPKK